MKQVNLYEDQEVLKCANCGKNLFENPSTSIVVFIENAETGEMADIYTCCKGECDEALKRLRRPKGYVDGWRDVTEFMNPRLYLTLVMAIMNKMYKGVQISEEAFKTYKNILLSTAPYVMRQPTEKEQEKAVNADMLLF